MQWITEGFEGFSKGTMENGGQNLYVSKKGVLQRIFQYDIDQDGHPDLLFACSQSMGERPKVYVYTDPLKNDEPLQLPTWGMYDGIFADLNGDGFDDLILASQHDGTHADVPATIYFGNPDGLSEQYRTELPAPCALGVCAGDFNGDGKKDLVFLSDGKLRVFYQNARGLNPGEPVDYEIEAASAGAADLDGDGFCDLYFRKKDGSAGIVFGSEKGLDAENILWVKEQGTAGNGEANGTTADLVGYSREWRASVLKIGGENCLFAMDGDDMVLSRCSAERRIEEVIRLHAPNGVAAAAGDLTGNGYEDIAVAAFTDRDQEADCMVFLGSADGYSADRCVKIPVKSCVNAAVADIKGPVLIFCRMGERVQQEVESPAYRFAADGSFEKVGGFIGGDCMSIAVGRPMGAEKGQQIAMINHKMHRDQGGENIFIYQGGEDGYVPDRRIELPAHSAVDGTMCDFFDTGSVDVLVCNCFEDAPHLDDGAYIYTNDGTGVRADRVIKIPTIRSHGVAIGDFRKSGYLDLAFGGFANRELRIFHGSEKGYSIDDCTKITLGPQNGYTPVIMQEGYANKHKPDSEEGKLQREFGEVRWLLSMDFNGDGWLDLFVSEIVGPRCYILWGGPDGFSWENRLELMADGVASATVADLNGNGWPDLILAQHMSTKKKSIYESYITVYWGGPDGYQENRKMQLPASCANSVTVGDYNGNGSLDIFATSYNNGRYRDLLAYLYPGDHGKYGMFNVQYLFNHSGSGCVSGDFNGDGYADLAVACHKEYGDHCSHSFIFWGGPEGLSDERKTILPTTGPHGMSTVDPGNIMDRGPKEHYVSEAFALPKGASVRSIRWEGECTSTSWVEIELRSAANEAELENAEWQTVQAGADISGLKIGGTVQYRLALCAKCSCGTPRITKVIAEY